VAAKCCRISSSKRAGAKAEYVYTVVRVKGIDLTSMKSETTRQEKQLVSAHLNARLNRLAEVMKEH
jgi:hypothetical protein